MPNISLFIWFIVDNITFMAYHYHGSFHQDVCVAGVLPVSYTPLIGRTCVMSATLTEMIGLLQEADSVGLSLGQIRKLLQTAQQKDSSMFQKLLEDGLIADLLGVTKQPDRNDFRKFLGLTPLQRALKIWKKIQVGTGLVTPDDFRQALKAGDYRLGDWASNMFDQGAFTVAVQPAEIELIVASNADLGRPEGCIYQETCDLIVASGHTLCEPEDGPQLRLQYPDQPKGESLILAMKPIRGSGGDLSVFRVGHGDNGRWLHAGFGDPDFFGDGGCRFVFRARKQVSS